MKGKSRLLGSVNYQIKLKYLLKLYNINLIANNLNRIGFFLGMMKNILFQLSSKVMSATRGWYV